MIDSAILRDTQRTSDAYRDLVIRISGNSVLSTELSPRAREEVVSRMEYGV